MLSSRQQGTHKNKMEIFLCECSLRWQSRALQGWESIQRNLERWGISFQGSCNQVPQTGKLKTAEMCCLNVEARSPEKIKVLARSVPPLGLRGWVCRMPLSWLLMLAGIPWCSLAFSRVTPTSVSESLLIRTSAMLDSRTVVFWFDLILTNYICNDPYFQTRSHYEVVGQTWTLGGNYSTQYWWLGLR